MRIIILFALVVVCSAQAIDIGSRRELFVDRYLLEDLKGTRLALQKPVDRGAILKYDKPWEGAFSNYSTIIHDGVLYRLYYRGLPTAKRELVADTVTCYAESSDGIHWTKPELGITAVNGSKQNNVILARSQRTSMAMVRAIMWSGGLVMETGTSRCGYRSTAGAAVGTPGRYSGSLGLRRRRQNRTMLYGDLRMARGSSFHRSTRHRS